MGATQADVWRFCAHLVDVDSADDLAQDTYVRAMSGAHRFRGDASATTWLLTIARRTCADELRRRIRRRRREQVVDPALLVDDTGPRQASADSQPPPGLGLDPALVAAVHALHEDRRVAFVLTQVLGLSYREAAQAAEVPIGTVRSRVSRARDDLATALGDATHDGRRHGDAGDIAEDGRAGA